MTDTSVTTEIWFYDVQDYVNPFFGTEQDAAQLAEEYPDAIYFTITTHHQ